MFLITLLFTSMVSAVKILNEERIERNEKIKLQRIILEVLGMPVTKETPDAAVVRLFQGRVKAVNVDDKIIYVGYEEGGRNISGYAFPVGGPGFWGPIDGLVAVDERATRIIGIAFYKHSETPGLGARMTEPWFRDQFKGLPLFPVEGGRRIFYLKPQGTGSAPNELSAITGATGTSRAVEAFLNKDLDHFLKKLWGTLKQGRDKSAKTS
jgi:Na+-transporting NADH:ubiquinone oxidoreductase subunit C